jgi:hypothetical protein
VQTSLKDLTPNAARLVQGQATSSRAKPGRADVFIFLLIVTDALACPPPQARAHNPPSSVYPVALAARSADGLAALGVTNWSLPVCLSVWPPPRCRATTASSCRATRASQSARRARCASARCMASERRPGASSVATCEGRRTDA